MFTTSLIGPETLDGTTDFGVGWKSKRLLSDLDREESGVGSFSRQKGASRGSAAGARRLPLFCYSFCYSPPAFSDTAKPRSAKRPSGARGFHQWAWVDSNYRPHTYQI